MDSQLQADILALSAGPGWSMRQQALLARCAELPGVRDQVVTCARCGDVGRPDWSEHPELLRA